MPFPLGGGGKSPRKIAECKVSYDTLAIFNTLGYYCLAGGLNLLNSRRWGAWRDVEGQD